MHLWLGFPVVQVSSSQEQRKPPELWRFFLHSCARWSCVPTPLVSCVTNPPILFYCTLPRRAWRYVLTGTLYLFTYIHPISPGMWAYNGHAQSYMHCAMLKSVTWVYGACDLVLLSIHSICLIEYCHGYGMMSSAIYGYCMRSSCVLA